MINQYKEHIMKKKIHLIIILPIIIISSLVFSSCKCNSDGKYEITTGNIENLIILIGDGMGLNHIHNTKIYFDLDKQPFENDYMTSINTNSLTRSSPTDSAAAATALSTGKRVKNGRIGHNDTKSIKNIMEYASDMNMLTGIITNDNLFGATPAAYSSHTLDRANSTEIVLQQSQSPIDLLIGQYDETYYNNAHLFTNNGFSMQDDINSMYSIKYPQKVIANLHNIYSVYNPDLSNQINMLDLVKYAIDYLNNDNGYVLMIECAYIDKFSHSNDIVSALSEVRTLFDIANYLHSYIDDNPDTALIITSDHETGGLKKATNISEISNSLYTTNSHTDSLVGLYSKGITLHTSDIIKNTVVFEMSYKAITKKKND